MLRFFRQIRQKLLTDNKFSKYLLYAVGEILLVVIGILIALQIDTWNEERKFRAQQYGLLKDLAADLEANLNELDSGRRLNSLYLSEYRELAQAIQADRAPSADIDKLCGHLSTWHSPFFTRTAYESLKNKGLEIIENDRLKQRIVALFEKDFVYLSEDYDKAEWGFATSVKTQLINRYIHYKESKYISKTTAEEVGVYPVDFERMKADQNFINMLSELINLRSRGISWYTETITEINDILGTIREELETLRP
jgi:hypothetical protein